MLKPKSLTGKREKNTIRVAIISLNVNSSIHERSNIIPDGVSCHKYSLYGADLHETTVHDITNNFVLSALRKGITRSYDCVVVSPSVLLYKTDWHKTLLQLAREMVSRGGRLVVYSKPRTDRKTSVELLESDIEEFLNCKVAGRDGDYVYFDIDMYSLDKSVLEWMAKDGRDYALRAYNNFEDTCSATFKDLGLFRSELSYANYDDAFPAKTLPGNKDTSYDIIPLKAFRELEYLGMGTGQKIASLKEVCKSYNEAQCPMVYVDHGSAAGFIPVQALMENDLKINKAVMIEPLPVFRSLAYDLFVHLPATIRSGIDYIKTDSDNYTYSEDVGLISFFHVYYLISPDKREAVFERAWNALTPGGTILLLEIPKTKQSEKLHYYDKMLTWQQLEELCAPYMVEAYLNPRDMKAVSPNDFIDKPVIRVIKKPKV